MCTVALGVGQVGDLGNVQSVGGSSNIAGSDKLLALQGPLSILGRYASPLCLRTVYALSPALYWLPCNVNVISACVIHADPDDLGRGGQPDSKTTGMSALPVLHCLTAFL